jgi:hypothetical protein
MRTPRRQERPVDPVESLLDFLIALRRFTTNWGLRPPIDNLDHQLSRGLGLRAHMRVLRERREQRRRGGNPVPLTTDD